MRYSIIIPYYDPKYLKAKMFTFCIESIVLNSRDMDYEFILVKDGPSYVESHNRGLRSATGDYIVIVNDDVVINDKEWLQKLTCEAGIATSRIKPENGLPEAVCWGMPRAVFEKLGLMDERYKDGFNYEDTDYFMTAQKLGIPFYERHINMRHFGEGTRKYYFEEKHEEMVAKNRSMFEAKWRLDSVPTGDTRYGKSLPKTMNRIYVPGTFDIPHYGHVELFKKAKALGTVIVGLNYDDFVARFKRRPVMTYDERKRMLEAIKYIDEVIPNTGSEDSKPAILAARATHILHGDDWVGDSYFKQMGMTQEWMDEYNIKLIYVPYTTAISTSDIIKRCQESR